MKTSLLTLMAVAVALAGCGDPSNMSLSAAKFAQDAATPEFEVKADPAAVTQPLTAVTEPSAGLTDKQPKSFFKQIQLLFSMQDSEGSADVIDGAMSTSPLCRVKFNVQGTEKLSGDTAFITGGKISFSNLTRKVHFQGEMDDTSEFMSESILYAHLQGTLDDGHRFSLALGQVSPYEVLYTFQVMDSDGSTLLHQYSGISEKGNLKVMRK